MALITEIIPQQGSEIVLNRLGAILFLEISNQITLQSIGDDFDLYIGRQEPYDKSEDVVIIVRTDNVNFTGQSQEGMQGENVFNIDIFCQGRSTQVVSGNTVSKDKMQRYLGFCRYILGSTKYKTLNFPMTGLIGGVYVQTIQHDLRYGEEDANFITFSRLQVSVRINECQELWGTNPFEGLDTVIKLDETEKGFKLIFNND